MLNCCIYDINKLNKTTFIIVLYFFKRSRVQDANTYLCCPAILPKWMVTCTPGPRNKKLHIIFNYGSQSKMHERTKMHEGQNCTSAQKCT